MAGVLVGFELGEPRALFRLLTRLELSGLATTPGTINIANLCNLFYYLDIWFLLSKFNKILNFPIIYLLSRLKTILDRYRREGLLQLSDVLPSQQRPVPVKHRLRGIGQQLNETLGLLLINRLLKYGIW